MCLPQVRLFGYLTKRRGLPGRFSKIDNLGCSVTFSEAKPVTIWRHRNYLSAHHYRSCDFRRVGCSQESCIVSLLEFLYEDPKTLTILGVFTLVVWFLLGSCVGKNLCLGLLFQGQISDLYEWEIRCTFFVGKPSTLSSAFRFLCDFLSGSFGFTSTETCRRCYISVYDHESAYLFAALLTFMRLLCKGFSCLFLLRWL